MKEEVRQYKFKAGRPVEFEILKISDLYRHVKRMLTRPHRADFYHIIWIEKGNPTHFVDFEPVTIPENSLLFVPRDHINIFDKDGNYDGKAIIFTDNFFSKDANDLKFLHSTILYNDLYEHTPIDISHALPLFADIFRAMEAELSLPADYYQQDILRNQLHNLLYYAEREKKRQGFKEVKPNADLDYVILFKDLLEKHFRASRTVNTYIADLSISEKRLNKATTLILNKTPKQMIDERLILESKRLLVHSSLNVKEIAFDLGFEEPTNFIKYFRKHTHVTPTEFREKYL